MVSRLKPKNSTNVRSAVLPREILRAIGVVPSEHLELFDYLEDVPLWVKDAAGYYRWVNVPFLLNYGIDRCEDILGRTDYDLSSATLANQYRLDDDRVLRGERILGRIELVGRFDHMAQWCATSKIPLHDERGRVVGTAGLTRPLKNLPNARDEAPLGRAVRYLSEHYARSVSNSELAGVCGMSVRALERHFLNVYHLTPHVYLRQLRVRMSCSGLVFTRKTLAQIASDVGYSDQSHFSKDFRRFLGETPSEYRTRYQRP
jgi:AraC-like DNA-binding protein